ncbi:hypothetical protein P6B95_03160 [Streptomyces atratus]|uniref:hypothetical protein n=1 Tax=Streptomyces atratus TaxID=1893 RepID=UPI00166FB3C7|nr:hypothetical protein [Streptomyces atratus]WPW26535.1 hypothetical protein P6B95_03160 [Streptomyces atratus]GGT78433.1 hypothetical protein GCM10010207_88060 [Streptomyces atratus]
MNTDAGTWPVCRGAQHLTKSDVDGLLAWVSPHLASAEHREMLSHVTATLCKVMDRRGSETSTTGQALAAVAAEWSLLRRIAYGHVIWAGPFVYNGPHTRRRA